MKGLKHKAYNRMCLCCKGKFRKSYDMSSDPASGSLFLVASYLKVASYCNIYMQYFSKKDFGEIAQPQRLKTKNWLSGSLSCSSCKKFSLRLSLTSRQADGSAAVPFVVVFWADVDVLLAQPPQAEVGRLTGLIEFLHLWAKNCPVVRYHCREHACHAHQQHKDGNLNLCTLVHVRRWWDFCSVNIFPLIK